MPASQLNETSKNGPTPTHPRAARSRAINGWDGDKKAKKIFFPTTSGLDEKKIVIMQGTCFNLILNKKGGK